MWKKTRASDTDAMGDDRGISSKAEGAGGEDGELWRRHPVVRSAKEGQTMRGARVTWEVGMSS